jgi:hypothetical protein
MLQPELDISRMPGIEWLGITILEPFTVLTNLFIAAVCFYAYVRLKKKQLTEYSPVHRYISLFFLLMGIATIVGGVVGHAFLYSTGMYGKIPGWYIGMAAVAFFERAAIRHGRTVLPYSIGRFFSVLNYLEILAFMFLSLYTLNFTFVILHAIYGLFVVVFCFMFYMYIKTKDPALVNIFIATGWGIAAMLCHAFQLGIYRWFNYNDVSHLAMTASVYYYYKAALTMQTESGKQFITTESL